MLPRSSLSGPTRDWQSPQIATTFTFHRRVGTHALTSADHGRDLGVCL